MKRPFGQGNINLVVRRCFSGLFEPREIKSGICSAPGEISFVEPARDSRQDPNVMKPGRSNQPNKLMNLSQSTHRCLQLQLKLSMSFKMHAAYVW